MQHNIPEGMIPFTIEQWKAGAKPICRNGYEPQDLHYFEKAKRPLVYTDWTGFNITCFRNGSLLSDTSSIESKYDLFLKAEKKEGYVAVYDVANSYTLGRFIYESIDAAKEGSPKACHYAKIEWHE